MLLNLHSYIKILVFKMQEDKFPLLNTIHTPSDLKKLPINKLDDVCKELRQYIIDIISHNPGHLGASLGTVELTVAIHYVFDTPFDKLVWDVGHQAYGHKILTGRKEKFHTIRSYKGISGFPKMSESNYDSFGTGHSSTSISAALGMAIAAKQNNDSKRNHIAVIGDGSMTAGIAFEAMNHAGDTDANILVILNDNGIAIDKSVGAIDRYLTDISTSKKYNALKNKVWNLLSRNNKYGHATRRLIQQIENGIKGSLLSGSNLFESFNFRYFGPTDGHDVVRLVRLFKDLKNIKGPKLLHVHTQKGKGLSYAEADQTLFHAPGKFNPETGELISSACADDPPRYQDVFGKTLVSLAYRNPKIIGITPAMGTGCSLDVMMQKIPDRAFDVGIAEQHAVTFAAGLATDGFIPFCNIYSSFLQRSFDQIVHDVALQKLPVILCIDRGGLVGEDGATHHGIYDIAFLRPIPNLIISSPMNEFELRNLMFTAQLNPVHPFVIRYPRGKGTTPAWRNKMEEIPIGKGRLIVKGNKVAILSYGPIGNNVQKAIQILDYMGIKPSHYDMRFVKPIDVELLHEIVIDHKYIITVEDGVKMGGFGSAISEFLFEHNYTNRLKIIGIPDVIIEHGSIDMLYKECGLDVDSLVEAIKLVWNE